MIKTIQKVIKVGDSLAVTIPARDARAMNIKAGSELRITAEPVGANDKHSDLMADYQTFVDEYSDTLRNLKDR